MCMASMQSLQIQCWLAPHRYLQAPHPHWKASVGGFLFTFSILMTKVGVCKSSHQWLSINYLNPPERSFQSIELDDADMTHLFCKTSFERWYGRLRMWVALSLQTIVGKEARELNGPFLWWPLRRLSLCVGWAASTTALTGGNLPFLSF